jgi:hypothetical protein
MKYHSKNYTGTEHGCIHCDYQYNYADLVESVGHEYIHKMNADCPDDDPMSLDEYIWYTEEIIEIICERYEDIQQSCWDCAEYDDMSQYKAWLEY